MARIAILTAEFAPFRGGIGTYTQAIAAAAKRLGHEVTVFAPDYDGNVEKADTDAFGFAVHRFRAGPFGPRWYPRYTRVALTAVWSKRFDQVLAADIPFIELLAATWPLHRYPYAVAIHGSEVNRSRRSLRNMMFAPAGIFTTPSHIFANSRFTRNRLLENYPKVSAEKVSVAYLGVAEPWFAPADPGRLRSGHLRDKKPATRGLRRSDHASERATHIGPRRIWPFACRAGRFGHRVGGHRSRAGSRLHGRTPPRGGDRKAC